MSGLQERITEAIAAHRTQLTFAPAGYWTCACGFAYKNRVPNEHAAHVAAAVIAALNLTEERQLIHGPSWEALGDGITVSSKGTGTATVNCHLCEKSFAQPDARAGFDFMLMHARQEHGYVPEYRHRYVTGWEPS